MKPASTRHHPMCNRPNNSPEYLLDSILPSPAYSPHRNISRTNEASSFYFSVLLLPSNSDWSKSLTVGDLMKGRLHCLKEPNLT